MKLSAISHQLTAGGSELLSELRAESRELIAFNLVDDLG